MAYDDMLAARIRTLLDDVPGITEQRMFGGLAFLVGGNLAVAASGQGGILVRADPNQSAALLAESSAQVMVMRGREMPGWLRVDGEDVETDDALRHWVMIGTTYARSLPLKR